MSQIIKERTLKYIIRRKLASNTYHINNRFGYQNLGVMMGMSGVQYSGSYGANLFSARSAHATPVDNSAAVAL